MKLQDICVSLKLAKELKEAGFPQESLHWWGGIGNMGIWCDHVKEDMPSQETRFTWYAAPTVAELGEALPLNKINCYKASDKENTYYFNLRVVNEYIGEAESEANARAKMWLYLKKEGLIK